MVEILHRPVRAPISGLYAVTPDTADTELLALRVAAAIGGGANAVQYRNKSAPAKLRLEQAEALRLICRDRATPFIVNDDVELAFAVDADGVHLGKDDAPVALARARLGRSAVIGVSCYDELERAAVAVDAGADYIAFGSFFSSAVKPAATRAQAWLLTASKSRWGLPVVAIGGITAANAASLIDAGADAVAVISAVFDAADVRSAARGIARLFDDEAVRRRG